MGTNLLILGVVNLIAAGFGKEPDKELDLGCRPVREGLATPIPGATSAFFLIKRRGVKMPLL